jgi:DNA-binding PadR family transcriptional regulator
MQATRPSTAPPPLPRTAMLVLLAIGPEERHGYAIMAEVARITRGWGPARSRSARSLPSSG